MRLPDFARKPLGRARLRISNAIDERRRLNLLRRAKGIIHIGANIGQERDDYARFDLDVLWIEPIPGVFDVLSKNIAPYKKQRALQRLVLDVDGEDVTFKISSNAGLSSSALDLAMSRDIWPDIEFVDTIQTTSSTLDTILTADNIDVSRYDTLILDTQGSELRVLKGATSALRSMKAIVVEVADFEAYAGCPRPEDLASFLQPFGFREASRARIAAHPNGLGYYDIVYTHKEA